MMNGFAFPIEIVRTNRKKSASIHLSGEVIRVRVPKTLSEQRIRALITRHKPWIATKLKVLSEQPIVKPKEYVSGEAFPYLGRNYRLKVTRGANPSLNPEGGYLVATVSQADKTPQATVKPMLIAWYKERATECLHEKTARLAKVIGVAPRSVTVKEYKSRWGSCSVGGDISYNWRIILAPHRIVDYVVVHELCHMREHNHSPRYWKQVERYIHDWKDARDWLKHNNIVF